ncbi:MAG: hypothetical protein ACRDR6_16010 [Pseudonocardiaceae bacterium]
MAAAAYDPAWDAEFDLDVSIVESGPVVAGGGLPARCRGSPVA